MTTRHEHESSTDVGPGDALQRAIDALPSERALPADAWTRLQHAVTASAGSIATERQSRRYRFDHQTMRVLMIGIAALLAVMLAPTLARRLKQSPPAETASALLPEERRDPRVWAVLAETRNWRAAAADSLRSMRWPLQARHAVETALLATETALTSARRAVRANPDDAVARDAIVVLRAKQLILLQRAMTLLDEI